MCLFNKNTGSSGGAIYISDNSTLAIYSSTFSGNIADLGGCYFCL